MSFRIIRKAICGNPGNQGRICQRMLNAIRWQVWKRLVRRPRSIELANGRRFIANPDCVISSALIYADWPEFHELQFLRKHLTQSDFLLDVGANVGHLGLLLSDIVDPQHIAEFEPTPLTFKRLTDNWLANGFETDKLFGVAVGSEDGTIEFPDLTHPGTMNSRSALSEATKLCRVPIRRLDSYRELWKGKPIGLLKIDVEGFELDVFRGAVETLHQDRPRIIMFESLAEQIDPAIEEQLKVADYRVFQLDENGRIQTGISNAQNLFACPAEVMSRFTE
jgi:FkbM family methyltransferase